MPLSSAADAPLVLIMHPSPSATSDGAHQPLPPPPPLAPPMSLPQAPPLAPPAALPRSSGADSAGPSRSSSGGALYKLLMGAAAHDANELADRCHLPPGFIIEECDCFEAPGVGALSRAFALEDPRVGPLPGSGPTGRAGRVAVLRSRDGDAIGYALHYDFAAAPWAPAGTATLPPRLAHLYISPPHRRRGLGTALLAWWRNAHAASVRLFSVDAPNEEMGRTLSRLGCAPAQGASGHLAQAVHYLHVPAQP